MSAIAAGPRQTKYVLDESRIPRSWYNIAADLPEPAPPVLHPGTGQPIGPGDLAQRFDSGVVDIAALKDKGLVPRRATLVKVLGDGDFAKKLTVVAHYFSASAKEMVEKAGGKVQILPQLHELGGKKESHPAKE